MATPFENGKRDGRWTREQVRSCGFRSALACLEHQERVYQQEITKLPRLHQENPAYAAKHAEYMEGVITATRETLRTFIREEQQSS